MPFKPEFLILYFDTIVWAVIPFRQYRKKYFYYFYFNNIGDYLTLYMRLLFHSSSNFFYIPGSILMLIFIQDEKSLKKYQIFYLISFIVFSILYFKLNLEGYVITYGLIHILILITLCRDFIKAFFRAGTIMTFVAAIILNEAVDTFKIFGIISGTSNGYFYFYASVAFEILIGFFFWIKADNPKLLIKLSRN